MEYDSVEIQLVELLRAKADNLALEMEMGHTKIGNILTNTNTAHLFNESANQIEKLYNENERLKDLIRIWVKAAQSGTKIEVGDTVRDHDSCEGKVVEITPNDRLVAVSYKGEKGRYIGVTDMMNLNLVHKGNN